MTNHTLKSRLAKPDVVLAPGVYDALSALVAEQAGFEALYLSGASIAYTRLGRSDIGLTTFTEVADTLAHITERVRLPVIVDADTGFGNALNTQRTVRGFERAGAAMIQIEDQTFPKRCGHLDGKAVVDEDTAVKRIRAAVDARRDPDFLVMARTDIRAVEGLEAAKDRARVLVDAGADAIFPEAMRTLEEFAAIREAVDVPVLANMTEFGKSELFTVDQLRDVGVNIVIWPVSLLRIAMGAAGRALDTLQDEGRLTGLLDQMQHRADLYDLIDYEQYNHFDTSVFNFTVAKD